MNSVSNNEIEITLNGANVSGCKWLDNNKAGLLCDLEYGLFSLVTHCSENPDCYYKQLQREKQKNKELTEDYNELHQRHDKAFQDFERLKEKNFEVEVDNALKSHRIDYLEEQLEKLGWKEEVQNDR